MMSKEAFIEEFGVPAFTVSAGCSGGSYGSAQPADRIPGLFDGVLIACTFPDPLSIAFTGSDGHLLQHYFEATNPLAFHRGAEGRDLRAQGPAGIHRRRQPGRPHRPDHGSRRPPRLQRRPVQRRRAARRSLQPHDQPDRRARHGLRRGARTSTASITATGFALRPFDNVGVQYGLAALNAGVITPTQFLDLNEGVGGYDQDANFVATRSLGDPGAMDRAQKSGLQLGGNGGLASIPVFDVTGLYNEDTAYHYQWFHFALRERMAQFERQQHRQPRDVARQPGAGGHGLVDLHRLGRGLQSRHLVGQPARQGHRAGSPPPPSTAAGRTRPPSSPRRRP